MASFHHNGSCVYHCAVLCAATPGPIQLDTDNAPLPLFREFLLFFVRRFRRRDDDCWECDPGYEIQDTAWFLDNPEACDTGCTAVGAMNRSHCIRRCVPWGGSCANGTLAVQAVRTQHNHCANSCNDGYYFHNASKTCVPWEGTCTGGILAAQENRRHAGHCVSCYEDHVLVDYTAFEEKGLPPLYLTEDRSTVRQRCTKCVNADCRFGSYFPRQGHGGADKYRTGTCVLDPAVPASGAQCFNGHYAASGGYSQASKSWKFEAEGIAQNGLSCDAMCDGNSIQ